MVIKDEYEVVKYHGRYGTTVKCPSCRVYTIFITPEMKRELDRGNNVVGECEGCEAYREHTHPY
jgi:hypothetical protein